LFRLAAIVEPLLTIRRMMRQISPDVLAQYQCDF
jgi:hypothetical protein